MKGCVFAASGADEGARVCSQDENLAMLWGFVIGAIWGALSMWGLVSMWRRRVQRITDRHDEEDCHE